MNTMEPMPDSTDLRKFAFTLGGLLILLFGVMFPFFLEYSYPLWPWIVFSVLAFLAVFFVRALRPIHDGWMFLGEKLGLLNTYILLVMIFYLVVAPIGLLMRLSGKEVLFLKFFPKQASYRSHTYRFSRDKMKRPF